MKKIVFLIALLSIGCFSQNHQIEYEIKFERKLSPELTEEFESGKNREIARAEIAAYENPKNEFYSLTVANNLTELTYVESLNNDQEKSHLSVSNFPFGKKNFRRSNVPVIYNEHKINNKVYYSEDSVLVKGWEETGKDSLILGKTVHQIKLKNHEAEYTAWYTKEELPKGFGIYNLSYDKGFVLAFEVSYNPNRAFDENVLKVYPEKIKKTRKKLKFPDIEKTYTVEEIKDLYKERNKAINQPSDRQQ